LTRKIHTNLTHHLGRFGHLEDLAVTTIALDPRLSGGNDCSTTQTREIVDASPGDLELCGMIFHGKDSIGILQQLADFLKVRLLHPESVPEFFGILERSSLRTYFDSASSQLRLEVRQLFQTLATGAPG
jgi:hypothetical protein